MTQTALDLDAHYANCVYHCKSERAVCINTFCHCLVSEAGCKPKLDREQQTALHKLLPSEPLLMAAFPSAANSIYPFHMLSHSKELARKVRAV